MAGTLKGLGVSPGVGVGKALIYRPMELMGRHRAIVVKEAELVRYQAAARQFYALREERAKAVAITAGANQAEIFRSQAAMVRDPYLTKQVEEKLAAGQCAEEALTQVCEAFIVALSGAEDEVARLRAADVQDMRDSMLRLLMGLSEVDLSVLPAGTVLFAKELTPSVMSSLNPQKIQAVVLESGGRTSHCAILARSLGIPAIVGIAHWDKVAEGTYVAVDGSQGLLHLDISPEEIKSYSRKRKAELVERESLSGFVGQGTLTADGCPVRLAVNVGGENDVLRAEELGCDGVGLFRTEYMCQGRDKPPDQEEQFRVYRRMALAMKGRPLVIRSWDLGGDKPLPGLTQLKEPNPFLGCRGVRLCLKEEEIFLEQLKAVLRAGAFGDVRLMLPMVTGIGEVRSVRTLLERAKDQLRRDDIPFREDLPLGVMVETAAAVLLADELSKEADFFSIGTNDLTQYLLCADRSNPQMASLCSYYHPAVLRAVRHTIKSGKRGNVPVCICGEAAADPAFAPLLMAWEVDEISVPPTSLLTVRCAISRWSVEKAREPEREVMELATEEQVQALLEKMQLEEKGNS